MSFHHSFDRLLSNLESCNTDAIVTGNFNLDYHHVDEPSHESNKLDTTAAVDGFQQLIRLPTRVTDNSNTIIHLTFSNIS